MLFVYGVSAEPICLRVVCRYALLLGGEGHIIAIFCSKVCVVVFWYSIVASLKGEHYVTVECVAWKNFACTGSRPEAAHLFALIVIAVCGNALHGF